MCRAQESWLGDWDDEAPPPSDAPAEMALPTQGADNLPFGDDLTFLPPDMAFDSPFQEAQPQDGPTPDSYMSEDMQDVHGSQPGGPLTLDPHSHVKRAQFRPAVPAPGGCACGAVLPCTGMVPAAGLLCSRRYSARACAMLQRPGLWS